MDNANYVSLGGDLHESYEAQMHVDTSHDTVPITQDSTHGYAIAVSFRAVFFTVHLRKSQRVLCFGSSVLLFALLLMFFLTLMFCFARVVRKLEIQQHEKYQGLHMVPDFDAGSGTGIVSLARDKVTIARYVETIDAYIEAYKKEQLSRKNFTKKCEASEKPAHAWCKFPIYVFEAEGCSSISRYGFDNGEPCFLFELKLQSSWTPQFNRNVSALTLKCDVYDQISMRRNTGIKMISAFGVDMQGGFPLNKIPSRTIVDRDGREVSDDNGVTLYDQPGLVFVKVNLGRSAHTSIRCFLSENTAEALLLNLANMPGRRVANFDVYNPYAQ
ncbi:unnamed protein product [Nippostrongylus brasiliensis]|uniref:Sodium/potassium-transporting ATPase subunit beta n=1 Tax=Nippostrongylus brasiliensis TaxID=27835 RepID=A0A0N4YE55_NIPBR|nr:unnamed protein product [Nippostrongylus brasiliensis]